MDMKRLAFLLSIIVSCQLSIVNYAWAQETFTERLQQPVEGKGTVVLRQDAEVTALVNGTASMRRTASKPLRTMAGNRSGHEGDTLQASSHALEIDTLALTPGHKVRMNGYRVQVYAGGNSRDAKRRAYQMEAQVRQSFPEQPVYTRFVSPRWICHVGDFRTREEALQLLSDMRKTGHFPEAITVRCKINSYLYE